MSTSAEFRAMQEAFDWHAEREHVSDSYTAEEIGDYVDREVEELYRAVRLAKDGHMAAARDIINCVALSLQEMPL
jgi:hypothetical protein